MILYTHVQNNKIYDFRRYVADLKKGGTLAVNWQSYEMLKRQAEQIADDVDQLDEMLEIIREVLEI